MSYIKINNVCKNYKVGDNTYVALKNINLEFNVNEFVAILGESGSGKSTLLNLIIGISEITKGNIYINDENIKTFSKKRMNQYHKKEIGIIFQKYNLIDLYNIYQNIDLVRNENINNSKILKLLKKIGIEKKVKNKINETSGGELQRTALIRALINDPPLLVLDEPTGALDKENSEILMNYLMSIRKDRLILFVTHNKELATKYATRIIELKDGEVFKDNKNNIESFDVDCSLLSNNKFSMKYRLVFILNLINKKKGRFLISFLATTLLLFFLSISLIATSIVNEYINYSFLSSLDSNVIDLKSYSFINHKLIDIELSTLVINELSKDNGYSIRKNYNYYLNNHLLPKLSFNNNGKNINLSNISICCMSSYANDNLLAGNMPTKINEVIINENLYNYLGKDNSLINKRFNVIDSNEYLKITGVSFSSLMNNSLVIYFSYDFIKEKFKDLDVNYYQLDIKNIYDINNLIKSLKNSNLYRDKNDINDDSLNFSFELSEDLENYYTFYELINLAKVVVYFFLGLTLIINIMLLSNIFYSFNEEEKRNIAILKILGFSFKEIASLSILIGLFVGCLSYISIYLFNYYIHDYLVIMLNNYFVNLDINLKLTFKENILIFLITIISILLSNIFPLIKIYRAKLDETLKED